MRMLVSKHANLVITLAKHAPQVVNIIVCRAVTIWDGY